MQLFANLMIYDMAATQEHRNRVRTVFERQSYMNAGTRFDNLRRVTPRPPFSS